MTGIYVWKVKNLIFEIRLTYIKYINCTFLFFAYQLSTLFSKHYLIYYICILFITSSLKKKYLYFARNRFLSIFFNSRTSTTIDLTCFADPIEVTIQFALKLLLSSQLQKGLSVLHFLSLLRKLSTSVIQMTWELIREHFYKD